MKIGTVGDVHWSKYASIMRARGETFSKRLENLIKSVSWAEEVLAEAGCDIIVYLGDFLDSHTTEAEEVTALNEIKWSNIPKYFLTGNHEISSSNTFFSSCKTLKSDNKVIIDKPIVDNNIGFIPYIFEADRKPLRNYFDIMPDIIFSHNDLKGIQMGAFTSKIGFDIDEIRNNCKLFVNGHLHNGGEVAPGVINLGNLTGQNFGEDEFLYKHQIAVIDTDTYDIDYIENPYAFNFAKVDLTENFNIDLISFKPNSIISFKVNESDVLALKAFLKINPNIIESRINVVFENTDKVVTEELLKIDHIKKFNEFILDKIDSSDIVIEELSEVSA